jgi:hypothetical protein
MRVENISVDQIVRQIQDEHDPRSLYEVVVHLCIDNLSLPDLTKRATELGIVNQLGLMVDIALNYVLKSDDGKYSLLKNLKEQLYGLRSEGIVPFYQERNPAFYELIAKHMNRINSEDMNGLIKRWGLITTLDAEKFKQVYEQEYEDRKEQPKEYSSVNQ